MSAVNSAGLMAEGWEYFNCMSQKYDMRSRAEHYACLVDLLGRSIN